MAKRKKTVKRRRRIGATGKGKNMEALLGLVAGAAAQGLVSSLVPDTVDKKLVAAGTGVVGFFLPSMVKNNALVKGVGDGMIAASGLKLLQEFGVVSGFPAINGYNDMKAINGLPPEIENFVAEPGRPKNNFSMANVINGLSNRNEESRLG